jgi:O-antigen ligase
MYKFITNIISEVRNWQTEKISGILNSSIPVFMGIYLFANPLPISAVNEFCFYLSVSALILLLVFKKTSFSLRSPLTLPFILFFLWAVFGLFFTLDFQNTLHDLRGHLLEYLIIFYLLVNYFNSQKRLEILSVIVIAGATLFSVGAINQYYFIEGFPFSARLGDITFRGAMQTDLIGFTTTFSSILALHLFHKNKTGTYKILFATCFLTTTATTLLTQSRGSLIGLGVSFIILCFANKRNLIFIVLVALLIFLTPGMRDRMKSEGFTKDIRTKINRLTLEEIKDHPIAGIGFGMQIYGNKNVLDLEKLNRQLPPEYQQDGVIIAAPHNIILDIAVRTGIVGLALFLYILITSLWMLWKTFRLTKNEPYKLLAIYLFASLTSFLLPALFADAMFGPRAIIFYTILAMITILWNLVRQEKTDGIIPSS